VSIVTVRAGAGRFLWSIVIGMEILGILGMLVEFPLVRGRADGDFIV
jgi:hypothetical protein